MSIFTLPFCELCILGFNPMEHPWEWDGLADVFGAGDEGDHPFDSDTKATVRDGTIFTQVQVEFVLGLVHFQGVHLGNEGIVVIFPHGTTDNFPITFWSQEVGTGPGQDCQGLASYRRP